MVCARDDDAQSFAELLNRNRTPVVQYLTRLVRNQAIAEELAQDVFVRVYRSRLKYEPTAKFTTWLYRITTNVALNHFRDERRFRNDVSLDERGTDQVRREAPDRAASIEDRMVWDAVAEQIRGAIEDLPAKQRAAVIMHKYDDMDYAQIAEVLGCTPAAVKALMFRAYETLRGSLRYLLAEHAAAKACPPRRPRPLM